MTWCQNGPVFRQATMTFCKLSFPMCICWTTSIWNTKCDMAQTWIRAHEALQHTSRTFCASQPPLKLNFQACQGHSWDYKMTKLVKQCWTWGYLRSWLGVAKDSRRMPRQLSASGLFMIIYIIYYIYIRQLHLNKRILIHTNRYLDYLREGFPWPARPLNIRNPIHLNIR